MNKNRVHDTLSKKPYYRLIRKDVFQIAKRIQEIDPEYFIIRNQKNGRYEVHNTKNIGNTYCFTVPFDELDARTLIRCRETSVERNVAEMVERHNEKLRRSQDRARNNRIEDSAKDLSERMAYAIDEDFLHKGYRKSHLIRSC